MAQIAIAVTKSTLFRGVQQEFSNVYHYSDPTSTGPEYAGLANEVIAIERALHSSQVNFKRVRVWTSGGSPTQNAMQHEADLTGTGTGSSISGFDKERAVLVRWPAGIDIRGKPVYLRKWFHSCGTCNGVVFTTGQMANQDEIPTVDRNTIASKANELRIIGALDQWLLCAESGRVHQSAGEAHRFLEHRQLVICGGKVPIPLSHGGTEKVLSPGCDFGTIVAPDVLNALLNAVTLYLLARTLNHRYTLDRRNERGGE